MTVCSGTLEHVELALLEGSELSSAVQAHLTRCSSCAPQAETLRGIVAALGASPAPAAPADLAARLVPLVLAEAQNGRRQGVFARALRPLTAAATSFAFTLFVLAASGGALFVYASRTATPTPDAPASEAPASEAPATVKTPATEAPATEVPATEGPATAAPATEAPVPTPTPELPRRTPEPVNPDPSEGESTAPTESTSP